MRLRTKFKVPIMAGAPPPRYPWDIVEDGKVASYQLQKQRDSFGSYIIAGYHPYSQDRLPSVTPDWNGFCIYMDYLYKSKRFIDKGRLFEIKNLAHSTSGIIGDDNISHRKLLNEYRHLESDDLSNSKLMYPFGYKPDTEEIKEDHRETKDIQKNRNKFMELIGKSSTVNLECSDKQVKADIDRKKNQSILESSIQDLFSNLSFTKEQSNLYRQRNIEVDISLQNAGTLSEKIKELDILERAQRNHQKTEKKRESSKKIDELVDKVDEKKDTLLDLVLKKDQSMEKVFTCDQLSALHYISTHMIRYENTENESLKLLLIGGPGTGKTYLINKTQEVAEERPLVCTAEYGSAASNLNTGSTLCKVFGFSAGNGSKSIRRRSNMNQEMSSLGTNCLPQVFQMLYSKFIDKNGILVIDEISLSPAVTIYHVSKTLKGIVKSYVDSIENQEDPEMSMKKKILKKLDPSKHFGGIDTILGGDFNQIPAIGEGLPAAVEKFIITNDSQSKDLSTEGAKIFLDFRRKQLTTNMRAKDDIAHINRIHDMTDTSVRFPINKELINYFKSRVLKKEDIVKNPEWISNCLYLTSSNDERILLNTYIAQIYAQYAKQIVVRYPLRIVSYPDQGFLKEMSIEDWRQDLRIKYPELWGYFIVGANATLTSNFKPEIGLSNGSQVKFSGMIFDKQDVLYDETKRLLENAALGSMVTIKIAPKYFLVETKTNVILKDDEMVRNVDPLEEQNTVFIVPSESQKESELRNAIIEDKILNTLKYRGSWVDLLFACTYHKAQGIYIILFSNTYATMYT
jgi:hypothetical protein